jgi:ABC-type polysaccharide/polyol phosphate transport system ATPase subunit
VSVRIIVEGLGIRFDLDRQRRPMTPMLTRLRRHCTSEWALRNTSFVVEPGEGVALVGANGAGKTTLMRAIAGVLAPDEGRIVVRGRIGSLLAVSAGLMPLLTGSENALLLSIIAGLPRAAARDALPTIRDRSGLDAAFEHPVSTYSQGMRARLGFAVIRQTDPDVLLLDEVHEAIDESFRAELVASVKEIRRRGGIVIAASHDRAMLGRLCDTALLLDRFGVHPARSFDEVEDALLTHAAHA